MRSTGLYWFTQDLRLKDNPNLERASDLVDHLICAYCIDPALLQPSRYHTGGMSPLRVGFLLEGLQDLSDNLQSQQQSLHVFYDSPVSRLSQLIQEHQVTQLFVSRPAGYDEQRVIFSLQERFPTLRIVVSDAQTLFSEAQLPFGIEQLPKNFTAFRHKVESIEIDIEMDNTRNQSLPPTPLKSNDWDKSIASLTRDFSPLFRGGELAAVLHSQRYFKSELPQHYKTVRNAIAGFDHSTKFSPWLSQGSLSPKQIVSLLRQNEAQFGANESTYWIYFELLWREYFHWYGVKHKKRLFQFKGLRDKKPRRSFYGERFQKWCHGNTPYPLVNACMKELKQTGYFSNRGRQIVASCFVNELGLDWRYGAAYFEQHLLDYDVASNWGNWQYIAGVGADPRGGRHFDLNKQQQQFDPEQAYIRQWQGQLCDTTLDSVDMVDWPIPSSSHS